MLFLSPVRAEVGLKQVGQYGTGAYDKVKIFGNYLYTVTCAGVDILDIRTPTNPILVSTFQSPGCAKDVAVSGNYHYAYVADDKGLWILAIWQRLNWWEV